MDYGCILQELLILTYPLHHHLKTSCIFNQAIHYFQLRIVAEYPHLYHFDSNIVCYLITHCHFWDKIVFEYMVKAAKEANVCYQPNVGEIYSQLMKTQEPYNICNLKAGARVTTYHESNLQQKSSGEYQWISWMHHWSALLTSEHAPNSDKSIFNNSDEDYWIILIASSWKEMTPMGLLARLRSRTVINRPGLMLWQSLDWRVLGMINSNVVDKSIIVIFSTSK